MAGGASNAKLTPGQDPRRASVPSTALASPPVLPGTEMPCNRTECEQPRDGVCAPKRK